MADRRLEEILKVLDPPPGSRLWHGGASVLGALRGVSADQARWRPAPDRHNIWELALHVAYWKYAVRRRITGEPMGRFPRAPSNWPAVPERATPDAWNGDRTILRGEHKRLIAVARDFPTGRLDEVSGEDGSYTFADLLMGVVLHDTHHAGQIQLLKRLHDSHRRS